MRCGPRHHAGGRYFSSMDLGLRDKRALVTAASKGLGRGAAEALTAEGARVFISSRNEDSLRQTAQEMAAAGYRTADVSSAEQVGELVSSAVAALGGLDVLVCNAGGPPPGGFDATDEEAWRLGFDLTLMSAVRLIRAALPELRRS